MWLGIIDRNKLEINFSHSFYEKSDTKIYILNFN